MQVKFSKSKKLPVLNSFFVAEPDLVFNTLVNSPKMADRYMYDRKAQVYEVDKFLMFEYFKRTRLQPEDIIVDDGDVIAPVKPELVQDGYRYQEQGGEYMSKQENCLLFFDTGTGKTRTTIHALNNLNPRRALIILGKAALATVWADELKECLQDYNAKHVVNASLKSTKDKVSDIKAAIATTDDTIILMNVEGIRLPAVREAINEYAPEVIIIDECQVIKGNKSLQTQGVFDLESKYRWALSATPVINNPLEWYSLLKWLRVHNAAKSRFDRYYGTWEYDRYGHYVCTGYQNQLDLEVMVSYISLRYIKGAGLPDLVETTLLLPLNEEEQDLYNQLMEMKKTPFLRAKYLSNGTPIYTQAQLFAYQRLLVSTAQSKIDYIKEQSKTKPVIVVSMLVEALTKIGKQVPNSVLYSGRQSAEEREKILQDFKEGKIAVLLLSLKAGGVGLTLTTAWTEYLVDAPNSQADYEQVRDRVHRISQTKDVVIEKLVAEGTHDEFAWEHMNDKYGWIAAYYQE